MKLLLLAILLTTTATAQTGRGKFASERARQAQRDNSDWQAAWAGFKWAMKKAVKLR